MIKYENQMRDELYNIRKKHSFTKNKGNKTTLYCNDIMTFDIEVSSAWLENGKVIQYEKGKDNEYWNNLEPIALPYIWQFGFNDKYYYGRELKDFEQVLKDIPSDYQCIIWVHNLSYEFHFLNNFLKWKTVFARTPHKPIKCVCEDYPNIEFRCSYMLTRLSLDSWGKQIGEHKATGYLDYETIRTPLTPLTDEEMFYCEQDLKVMYKGLLQYRFKYDEVREIPLTQTGTVRKVVKDLLMKDVEYVKHVKKLIPRDIEEYNMLMNIFAGGYTHANRMYSGVVQTGHIEHYDFASSYPTVMVAEKYPDTKWREMSNLVIPSEERFNDYAYILKIKFRRLNILTSNTYIQASKCECKNAHYDNGRVLDADELIMTMTEQDYLTIKETYEWEKAELLEGYYCVKRYLPKKFVEYILELYGNKTSLKGVEGQEDLYMQSKQYINSLFGMCVTAIVQSNIEFVDGVWNIKPLTSEYVNEFLDKLRDTRPREKRYFLSYSWGCWVTAYARRNLWKCITSCDDEVLYCDTDSIFVLGKKDFSWYNKEITEKLKKACDEQGIEFALTRPKTIKGKEKPLGIFDAEDVCIEFVTLGAKRYVERRENDKQLHLTVSGVNKEAVELLEDNIENFQDNFNFDKDAECVNKKLLTYLTNMPKVKFKDGYISTYKEGINMRRIGYQLTMTDEYKDLISYQHFDVSRLDDQAIMRLKNSLDV